jgi:hypothetical protein
LQWALSLPESRFRGLLLAAVEAAKRPPLWVRRLAGALGKADEKKSAKEIDDEFDRHFGLNLKGGAERHGR